MRAFNEKAGGRDDVTVLNVSADLPIAQSRFCGAEGIDGDQRVDVPQRVRHRRTASDVGGAAQRPAVRAVVMDDGAGKVAYTEQVPEIGQEPDYDAALGEL